MRVGGATEYEYDTCGRIVSIKENNKLSTYQYDKIGQLIRENKHLDKTFIYSYNEIGNITSVNENEMEFFMRKNILKVYYGTYIMTHWIVVFSAFMLLVVFFVLPDSSPDTLWDIVLVYIILLSILTFSIIDTLYRIQRAEISEEGITIYSVIFSTIKVIKWNELYDVRTESLITFTSVNGGYNSSRDWIVLYTDSSQKERMWGAGIDNRKKKGPWYIACTKENLAIITEYLIKYAPHICDDPNVFF